MKKGFTLIELLIVVAIIAILAAIAVPNFLEAQTRSKVARTKADMRSIGVALDAYHVDFSAYPPTSFQKLPGYHSAGSWFLCVEWAAPVASPGGRALTTCYWSMLTTPVAYLTNIPYDEFMSSFLMKNSTSIWGRNFIVKRAGVIYGTRVKAPVDVLIDNARYRDVGCFLTSIGPALIFSYGYISPRGGDNNPLEPCIYPFTSYDPTNGTISKGMITWCGTGFGLKPE